MRAALDHLEVIIKTESNYLILSRSNLITSMLAEDMGSGEDGGGGGGQAVWIRIPALSWSYNLSKLLNLFVPQFPHYKMGMLSYASLLKLL